MHMPSLRMALLALTKHGCAQARCLAESHAWDGLEAFVAEVRRSPIGYEPFVELAKKHGAPTDVQAR
jgi:vacuolar protein sorting-associated protein 16